MNKEPLVSIVIPVYNGANYLQQAIDSALAQTFHNIEVLVVNDGSKDDGKTEAVALAYGDRIRYFNKPNGGVSSALNFGINEMKGDYFAWLSHDDIFTSARIATDLKTFAAHPDAKITYSRRQLINDAGELGAEIAYPLTKAENLMDIWELLGGVSMCCLTIAKECFTEVGLFDETNRMTQDVEMCLRLGKKYTFYFNSGGLFLSREHAERGTHTQQWAHQQSLILVASFLRMNTVFADFFPNREPEHPANYNCWIKLGQLYEFLGDHATAETCFNNSIVVRSDIRGRINSFCSLLLHRRAILGQGKLVRFLRTNFIFFSFTFSTSKNESYVQL